MLEKRIGVIMYQTSNSKGQELVAQRMVRDFNKLGQKAYLITSTYHDGVEITPREGLLRNKGYYCVDDNALGIPVIRVESALAKWPPRRIVFRDFISTLNRIVDDFDLNVLISHSTLWNGPEETAKFVTWRRDMQKVGGYRDPIVFCHMSHFQEPSSQRYALPELTFRTAWNKISLSKILEAANRILVVTPMEKQAKIKMGAKPEKCFLYPGGVDNDTLLRYAAEDVSEFLKRHNIASDSRVVSYLGTLEERKNPMAVLKVAEQLKERTDIHFILAGKSGSTYGEEIIRLAKRMPNVSYLGEIDEREKALLIRASYLNILMSRLEALGISQLEFMYCGVPIITSGVGGQSWVVQNGVEGIHTQGAGDIAGAASAIIRLVDDRYTYKQMSVKAKERAGKFASINITSELDSVINEELSKESGLTEIPSELRNTLTRPENVLKSWSAGTSGIVATTDRLFIRQGIISRRVFEVRYSDIHVVEHMRRLLWGIPIAGAVISCLVFMAPSIQGIFATYLVDEVKTMANSVNDSLPQFMASHGWTISALPFILSLILFFVEARTGFQLHIDGTKPIYLSGKYKNAIKFIRNIQDKNFAKLEKTVPEKSAWESVINSN
jgi:D-inositol-3-phosphate glycosyltransferase